MCEMLIIEHRAANAPGSRFESCTRGSSERGLGFGSLDARDYRSGHRQGFVKGARHICNSRSEYRVRAICDLSKRSIEAVGNRSSGSRRNG
jgi:hypothetical protein